MLEWGCRCPSRCLGASVPRCLGASVPRWFASFLEETMAKQTPVLVKSFAADTAINSANVCVVASGTNAGNVALPGGALATKFVGVTFEPVQTNSLTNEIAVQVAGIAQIQTDGSANITARDFVAIANS